MSFSSSALSLFMNRIIALGIIAIPPHTVLTFHKLYYFRILNAKIMPKNNFHNLFIFFKLYFKKDLIIQKIGFFIQFY